MLSLMKIPCVHPTVKFLSEEYDVEKKVELRENEATCEAEEGLPQSNSEAEASAVPLSPREHHNIAFSRPKRSNFVVPPTRYDYEDMVAYALQVAKEVDPHEPSTYKEVVTGTEFVQWLAAMGDEMKSLENNQTWELARRLPGRKVVTCKWLFKKKEMLSPAEGIKYKTRLVARGFSRKEGVDYNEILSPVVRHTSIRVLLAIVAHQDLELKQLDVKTYF